MAFNKTLIKMKNVYTLLVLFLGTLCLQAQTDTDTTKVDEKEERLTAT